MEVLVHFSDIIIPAIIFYIIGYGLISKVKVYETFLNGAKDGLKVVVDIVPTLIGLMVAVGVLRASGFLGFLGSLFAPLTEAVGLPGQIFPLMIIKLFSASAATGLVLDVFKVNGPDSYVGMFTSILMSVVCNFGIVCLVAMKSLWWVPFAIPARMMYHVLGVLPNGLVEVQEEMYVGTGIVSGGIVIGVVLYIIMTYVLGKAFIKQEV